MATNFPGSLDSYTTKVNNVDTIDAAHVNNLQDAMVQVETILGAGSTRRDSTSWSPVLTFSAGTLTSVTYGANNIGFYARFGSIVFVSARVDVDAYSLTGGPGNLTISLPSQVVNSASSSLFAVRALSGFSALGPAVGTATGNTSTITFASYNATGNSSVITSAHASTGGFEFSMSGFYFHS